VWKSGLCAALLVALGLLAGCDPDADAGSAATVIDTPVNEMVLTAKDNGSQAELEQGQALLVTLESNPTTGYRWEVSGSVEPALRQIGEAEFQPQSDLVGAPGVETLRFEAVGPGELTLKLVYHRPWEKGVEPLETFSVYVSIR
jgi:inhibitor of cysteine peptidase